MKRLMSLATVVFVFGILFASCASVPPGARDSKEAQNLLSFLASGDSARIAKQSASPFLLDQDIVALKDDTLSFWKDIAASKFDFRTSSYVSAAPVDDSSAARFADTMDVKVFFEKYVDKKARVYEFSRADGKTLLLVARAEGPTFRIFALKGPY